MRFLFPVTCALLLTAHRARADECNRPDIVDTLPKDTATGVPTNARLVARYEMSAEYLGESVLFGKVGEEPVALEAVFNANEGLVEVIPPEPLEPGSKYSVEWPKLRGIATASLGRGARVEFTAGDDEDTEPPRFAGVEDVTWHLDRERDECTDRRDERFVFDLTLSEPRDDGGRDSLALIVFQTAGPGITAMSAATPVLAKAMPEEDRVRVRLLVDDAVGRVCFAAIVRDLVGHVSPSGSTEVCTETEAPPFFQGCAVGARVAAAHPIRAWLLLGIAIASCRRLRRHGKGARPTS